MIALKGNVNCAIAQLDATCALNQIQHVHVKYYTPTVKPTNSIFLETIYPSVYLSIWTK